MVSTIFSSLTLFLLLSSWTQFLCMAGDNMTSSTPLRDEKGDTLVSAGERFELGFFTPHDRNDGKKYLGIWYYRYMPRTVVWVANRENPVDNSTGVFSLGKDGNLQLMDASGASYWSTRMNSSSVSFILIQEVANSSAILWQSFANPTDTFLPGMKLDMNMTLTSWKSPFDPAPGDFKFQLDGRENQYIIMRNGSIPYWKSAVSGSFLKSDGRLWLVSNLLMYSRPLGNTTTKESLYDNITSTALNYSNTKLVMNFDGQIQFFLWRNASWILYWLEPSDRCSFFDACGTFGSCNSLNRMLCKCLPGFQPKSPDNWKSGNFSEGCERISPLCNKEVAVESFLELKMMKAGKADDEFDYSDEYECFNKCLSRCECQAYSYQKAEKGDNITCWIWLKDLNNIQEDPFGRGRDLNVRVPSSTLALVKRKCEICGTTIIPYPLSTGPNCGDKMYYSFHCDDSIGQLSFEMPGGNYLVTGIDEELQKFSIRDEDCKATKSMGYRTQTNHSWPFNVIGGCDTGFADVEIRWTAPSEPLCSSLDECNDWPHSTCTSKEKRGSLFLVLLGVIGASVIIPCASFLLCYLGKSKKVTGRENKESNQGNAAFNLKDAERRLRDLIYADHSTEDDKKGIEVQFFDMDCILAATDNFSNANKLGQGGFGPVYKGIFPGGQEIAIKRLSSGSGQGMEEFKNEITLIAKLQHCNLVRLLGYCVQGCEKMLLYEYMPNKSLDAFIFDRTLCVLLNWELRFNIIVGIARGLLYLHRDSRLKIIHRDLKTSNVLLDEEMNPKISDFGLARIFSGKQTEENTQRVVGTYGYMAPEYAMDGVFSMKSDVFSFGVVVLEILSGKRNKEFYKSDKGFSLSAHAWRLWKEEKVLDLMDRALCETCDANEFVRCVNVGLLCVQEHPWDRPTMSTVALMLGSDTASLPTPNKPAFSATRSLFDTASSSSQADSYVDLTNTLEQGR
ncbi:G-type lectin S-receptor serine/threonine-protein kinase [Salix suchowensis]|nr:G-type lectin S-receptor serine/threonine-protein kinase [Salix suchowensis]